MKKVRINYYLLLIVIVMIVGATAVILININTSEEPVKIEEKKTENNHFNYDYKYILSYNYLSIDYFIYLLEDDDIKVVSKEMVYDLCAEENCIKPTDKVEYKEIEIDLNEKAKKKAREVISSFFIKKDSKEIDLTSYKIDDNIEIILSGIIEGDSNIINLVDDLIIEKETRQLKNSRDELIFTHSYNYVLESDNEIVNKIASHINKIVKDDFDELLAQSKEFLEYMEENSYLGVSLKLNVEYMGSSEISISYTTEGNLGGVNWFVKKGYVYSTYSGEIKTLYETRQDEIFDYILTSFKNSELYHDNNEQLSLDYESILKSEVFKVGNYYVTQDEVVYLTQGYLLGFAEATAKMVEIRIQRR